MTDEGMEYEEWLMNFHENNKSGGDCDYCPQCINQFIIKERWLDDNNKPIPKNN